MLYRQNGISPNHLRFPQLFYDKVMQLHSCLLTMQVIVFGSSVFLRHARTLSCVLIFLFSSQSPNNPRQIIAWSYYVIRFVWLFLSFLWTFACIHGPGLVSASQFNCTLPVYFHHLALQLSGIVSLAVISQFYWPYILFFPFLLIRLYLSCDGMI